MTDEFVAEKEGPKKKITRAHNLLFKVIQLYGG